MDTSCTPICVLLILILITNNPCAAQLLRQGKIGDEYFTSIQSLTYLVTVENRLLEYLTSHRTLLVGIDPDMDQELTFWMREHMKAVTNPEKYVSHPITCFQLIKRLTVNWIDIRETITPKVPANFTEKLERDIEQFLPSASDLNGVAHGISFLCSVYSLPFDEFMRGKILDKQYDAVLSELSYVSLANNRVINAFLIAMEFLYRTDYPMSLLKESLGLFGNLMEALNSTGNTKMGLNLSDMVYRKLNSMPLPEKPKRQLFQNDFIRKQRELLEAKKSKEPKSNKLPQDDSKEAVIDDFKKFCAFCKYPNLSSSVLNKQLFCRFKRDLPFLTLSPLKMEELNLEPMVVLFHDAISDDDIQRLKDATIPYMERAVVVNHDEESRTEKGQNYSDSRISETAWLNEGDDPDMDVVLNRLTVRMNHMSGKRMMTSESLQVNNYGIGGYFAPHFDAMHYNKAYLRPNNLDNREATIMFYMTEVEQGGATVFLDLQLAVPPQKGTALFWYNLRPDRSVDLDTLHGACPVLVGNKWVCNKWIHFFDTQPYSLPDSIHMD
ncbi:hypothetical protein M8J75_014038 [Diaphorina citri]|nr:hypothetical protein M8J75_014038 [Diaphorina citri]KAI5753487.1 hypothetical protein M8J77_000609 [Diaphorina citri]